jgi:hypothetical protein
MRTISQVELSAALTEIDAKARSENVNIPARPLYALSELSTRFQMAVGVPSKLADSVFSWFDRLYGDRLQMGLTLGTTAVLLGGDIYKLRLPLMYGTSAYALDEGPLTRQIVLGGRSISLSNIVQYVDQLTPARVGVMTMAERNNVVSRFACAMVAGSDLDSVKYPDFVSEAKADLVTSVEHLLTRPAQYGLSRWSSLQSVEKLLKAFIQEGGGQPERIHVLTDLAQAAEKLGLSVVNRTALSLVQCSAGVRYGSDPSTLLQAIEAHHNANRYLWCRCRAV